MNTQLQDLVRECKASMAYHRLLVDYVLLVQEKQGAIIRKLNTLILKGKK